MSFPTTLAGEFMLKRGGSVNPSKFPDEIFDLLSIPAFDKQSIEMLRGEEIGSSKSLLQPRDVLLSKIIPHIRRCWVVPENIGRRQIGSGEWMIFRGKDFYSEYLKHFLTSNIFHQQFMNTVAGVGGSLVRARPAQVELIEIPLPPLPEQKKIAEILDVADSLRQKDKQLIEHYNTLSQSLFLDMFGDPVTNSMSWDIESFDYFASIDTKMTKDFEKFSNVPHIGIANIEKQTGKLINYNLVGEENIISGKYIFTPEHIIYSKIRPNLNKVALPDFDGLASADSYPILVRKENSNKAFFAFILRSQFFLDFISKHSNRTNIPKANKAQLKQFECIAPPLKLQTLFSDRFKLINIQKEKAENNLKKSEDLFNSLLQRAFKGELTN